MKSNQKKSLTLGLIGLGNISNIHMETYEKRNDVHIKAISDSNHGLLLRRAVEWNVHETYPDYQFLLKDNAIDVIDVMTPHFMHAQCVCDALAAGKTVICEKPLVTTAGDLAQIVKAVKKTKKQVYVKQYLRFSQAYQKAKVLLSKNTIGKPYYISCMFTSHSVYSCQRICANKKNINNIDSKRRGLGDINHRISRRTTRKHFMF